MDKYSFLTNYLNGHLPDAYKYFGAHKMTIDGKEGYLFRVYAPMAKKINLVGDFNFFDKTSLELKKVDYRGLFELFVPGAKRSQKYKYLILGADNVLREKQDPFAFSNEMRVDTCSILEDLNAFSIHDEEFIKNRTRNFDKPVSIYELHMGTFKVKEDGSSYTYAQLADVLIPYLKDMAYTHVELLPITSYPNDASWGYQVSGYYAVDGRWGTIDDFAMFVEKLHKANIGIILDFVPVHFATDSFGLERFDGTCMYEYDNENEYSSWGSKNFDLGKDPVRSFLISSLFYFVDTFHIDGFRFDAVSNIIYWDGNKQRGVNDGAIEFVKRANGYMHTLRQDVMMIAEDSSAFPHVTKGFETDTLGFDYKWDLGWMNDTLKYYAKDPVYRKFSHNQLTFSMAYYFSENFLLPLSHDEVVHMKGTILNKMWGSYDNKFANLRNLYAYQFAHPGKKLNFMGNDIATFDEWKEYQPISFEVLDFPKHKGINNLIKDLNRIYINHPAFYKTDYNPQSFSWIMADNVEQSVYIFKRECEDECIICIFNMTPNFYWDYDVGVPYAGVYEEILNTDKERYGGWNQYNGLPLTTYGKGLHNQNYKITIKLASFGAIYLRYDKHLNIDDKKPYVAKDPNYILEEDKGV